jgi:DNA-directed RNA polymerase subunit delta
MKIDNLTKAELESFSDCDLTALLLKENNKPMNTAVIFKKICELLGYSDDEYMNKIGDFYTSLATDKRFVLLDSAEWDLRDNHSIKIDIDEEEEEEEAEEDELEEEMDEEEIDDMEESLDNDELDVDDVDDDLDDFQIVDDDEEMDL